MAATQKFYGYTPFIVFDGTNGAAVVAEYNSNQWPSWTDGCTASLTSQVGGVAVLHFSNTDFAGSGHTSDVTLNTGDSLTINNTPSTIPGATQALYRTVLGDGGTNKYGGYGEGLLGALTVGSTNIAVTIKPAQPDTGYVASAFLDGPALALGTVSLGTPVKTSASVVTVPVINTGLLPITLSQSTVTVHVTAPQS